MNQDQIKHTIIEYITLNSSLTDYKLNMINRYINFIYSRNNEKSTLIEMHHILPKSLFPEYNNFKTYSWNRAILTLREHFIAHIMLHFIFENKMTYALYHMIPQALKKYNLSNEIYFSRLYEFAKIEYKKNRAGFACYKDSNNKKYFLHKDDKLIDELNLVGNLTGFKFTDEHKSSQLNSRNNGRGVKIIMYFMNYKRRIFRDQINRYLDNGWNFYRNEEDMNYIKKLKSINSKKKAKIVGDRLKNGMRIMYDETGKSYGHMYQDDPRILQYNLKKYKNSEKQISQMKHRLKLSNEKIKNGKLYNNGFIQKLFQENDIILEDFVLGGLSKPKKSTLIFNPKDKLFKEEMHFYLSITNGTFDDEYILERYKVTSTFMARLCLKNDIDYRQYWIPKKRYMNDKNYALMLYELFDKNIFLIAQYLVTNIDTCRNNYKRKYNIEF